MDAGVQLLNGGTAPVLFVSGVDHRVDPSRVRDLVPEAGDQLDQKTIDCCIVLGYGASDTLGNARETALLAQASGRRPLVLVTSNSPMPRARLELEHAMPGALLAPSSLLQPAARFDRRWRWRGKSGAAWCRAGGWP